MMLWFQIQASVTSWQVQVCKCSVMLALFKQVSNSDGKAILVKKFHIEDPEAYHEVNFDGYLLVILSFAI